MSEWPVRAETDSDHDAIASVVARAFGSPREAELVAAIRESPNFVADWSLVALSDDRVVGHVLVSYVTLQDDNRSRRVTSLAPLAVDPDFHGRGIGGALVHTVTERVDRAGEPLIVLEGDPGYYGRFGFEPAAAHGVEIQLPSWAPPDAAQVLRLAHHDRAVRGRVVYPPAFDDVTDH